MYQERLYRNEYPAHWHRLRVTVAETDLLILSAHPLNISELERTVHRLRRDIESVIVADQGFATALSAYHKPVADKPVIVQEMIEAGNRCDVGPMAAVAGAVAEAVAHEYVERAGEIIVENGGDIFVMRKAQVLRLRIFTGDPVWDRIVFEIPLRGKPCGICSSSGRLGPSLSLGRADLVMIVSSSCAFADALATRVANMVVDENDIDRAVAYARSFALTSAVLVVRGESIGLWGDLRIAS